MIDNINKKWQQKFNAIEEKHDQERKYLQVNIIKLEQEYEMSHQKELSAKHGMEKILSEEIDRFIARKKTHHWNEISSSKKKTNKKNCCLIIILLFIWL